MINTFDFVFEGGVSFVIRLQTKEEKETSSPNWGGIFHHDLGKRKKDLI